MNSLAGTSKKKRRKLSDRFYSWAGVTSLRPSKVHLDEQDKAAVEFLRATQEVRVAQSARALPLVFVCALLLVVDLWEVIQPHDGLFLFVALLLGAATLRGAVCRSISKRLMAADPPALNRFEVWLFWSALLNSGAMGAGFWLVAGPEAASFDISLASCLFAIGAMINASVQTRSFVISISANLGQGILFGFGLGDHFDPFIGFMLVTVLALLVGFGRENGQKFAESFRMREEKVQLLRELNEEKKVVENALFHAKEAVADQSRFLAAASHDLRQPLHAISLFLGPLRKKVEGQEQAEHIVDRIVESSDLLAKQLNDMLDLYQLDAKGTEIECEIFSLSRLLERVVEGCRGEAEAKGLKLKLDHSPLWTESDPILLDRVVRNLLENALRYTEEGTITVSCKSQGERIEVGIKDTGPGISEKDCLRIFDDFVQLDGPARGKHKGAGLGLASVRRIDKLLDLELRVNSRVGEGSEFVFWLPLIQEKVGTTNKPSA